jgi:hypothetical protein
VAPHRARRAGLGARPIDPRRDINRPESCGSGSGSASCSSATILATAAHISHRIAVSYLGRTVALADAVELCKKPLHPCTQALFAAALPAHPDEPPALPAGNGALRGRSADPEGGRAQVQRRLLSLLPSLLSAAATNLGIGTALA